MTPAADLSYAHPLTAADLQTLLATLLPVVMRRHGDMLTVKECGSGRYAHVNELMAGFLRRDSADVMGRADAELFDAALAGVLRSADQAAMAQREPLTTEHRFDWHGERREFEVTRWVSAASVAGGSWLCLVWSDLAPARRREAQLRAALEQIEQQQRANELLRRELADQAMRDPTSGLYRRAHFDDQLRRELDLSTREHREFSVVFIEIDAQPANVQALSDAGVRRIQESAGGLLRSGTRAMDASCRYDDHRFAVLLSGVGLATAHARMESLRRKCAAQIVVLEGQELRFTVAMGVASFPHTADSQEALVQASEAALTEAQRRGGNQLTLAAIRFASA